MRFHRLSVTAFGPYAATETVDFDELNDAGIFLLTGPAGAGKTSILDAICFALYGVVPGMRGVRSLRSHHAEDGVAPEVVLEATIAGRRYRIRRSPEWHRPKKRGTGTTKENASATLLDLTDGDERLVSSRVAEVGHELGMALGMTSEQFMQVVMLPQGQFQTFLHASSDERQGVLQRLFHTQRFARVEEWMRDRTRELCERAEQREQRVSRLLSTVAHRAGTALPEPLAAPRLGDVGQVARRWGADVLADAERTAHQAQVAEERARAALESAEDREREVAAAAEVRRRRVAATAALADLEQTAAAADVLADLVAQHDLALRVEPLLRPLADADRAVTSAQHAHDAALAAWKRHAPRSEGDPDVDALDAELEQDLARLRSALPHEARLDDLARRQQATEEELALLDEQIKATADRAAALPAEREELVGEVAEAASAAEAEPAARKAAAGAARLLEAAQLFPGLQQRHRDLVERAQTVQQDALRARAHHLDLLERRLAGIAAELAGQLTEGSPCQVCGGTDHPAPAEPGPDAVTLAEQRAAQADQERLQARAEEARAEAERAAEEVHRVEVVAAGTSTHDAAAHHDACRAALARATAAAARLPRLRERLAQAEAEAGLLDAQLEALRSSTATHAAELATLRERVSAATAAVAEALAGRPGPVSALVGEARHSRALLDRLRESRAALDAATARRAEAAEQAAEVASELGFTSLSEARSALLPPAERDSALATLDERDHRRRAAHDVLDSTAALVPDEDDAPPLDEVRGLLQVARRSLRESAAAAATSHDRATALAGLVAELEVVLADWEPARAEHATAESLSKLVRGMGTDNQLQMRLSSYVLATRLDQVLDAANERLSDMRDQRYSLRRTGTARGGTRAGLGLELLDAWTGEPRSPTTLSGGETFVVSLALALGLADVVMHESGGLTVETLFIDEGFGMLDPDTLDDVMDRIDALRAGGRTVGVVSHVPELRSRIPAQLHVDKGRDGSTLSLRNLVA